MADQMGVGTIRKINVLEQMGKLEDDERIVLHALKRWGYDQHGKPVGRDGAVTARVLADEVHPLVFDHKVENESIMRHRLETCKRRVRKAVNALIIKHGIPICCEPGLGGGYYLPASDAEVEFNHSRFHKRAMTGLVKATRARKAAYADAVIQLTLGFEREARAIMEASGKDAEEEGPPPWVSVVTGLISQVRGDPEKYAAEIKQIQDECGDIFVRRDKVREIKRLTAELNSVLSGLERSA